ncbi:hypothetical protein [Cellulomonas shaoxiangyii]|uniref:hypothetical protein n=1 Tax=Cellulomonas shaoxiangyii TaxID=2566013 RepID=UPI00140E66EE|nr:hypothetical protein [Cellulomonas shaoxiangyii]
MDLLGVLLVLLVLLGAVALAVALVRAVRDDGLGHRPPPPVRPHPPGDRPW